MHKHDTPFSQDEWKLFNLADDPSEIHNLAQQNPAKLKEMQELWTKQAQQYGGLPLTESPFGRGATFSDAFPRHDY